MTDSNLNVLREAIDAGDAGGCLRWFHDTDKPQHRAAEQVAKASFERHSQQPWLETAEGKHERNPRLRAAALALIACGTLEDIKRHRLRHFLEVEDVVAVLAMRRPKWLAGWVQWMLDENRSQWTVPWRLVNALVDAKLCPRPSGGSYTLAMIYGVTDAESLVRQGELLEREVWNLFTEEGGGEFSLAAHDKYIRDQDGWAARLAALAESGALSRDRLLDASLESLSRDFAQFRAGWFSRFHERLAPTLNERADRADRYLLLFGSSIKPTVSFALKAVQKLCKADLIAPAELVDKIPPVLSSSTKSVVTSGLKLLSWAADKDARVEPAALRAAAAALLHEDADIQAASLKLLRRSDHAGEDLIAFVREAVSVAAPSVRNELHQWLSERDAASLVAPQAASLVAATRAGQLAAASLPLDLTERAARLEATLAERFDIPQALENARGLRLWRPH